MLSACGLITMDMGYKYDVGYVATNSIQ